MKTPRDILLNRHGSMEPKLDAARFNAVKKLEPRAVAPTAGTAGFNVMDALLFFPKKLWMELVFPARRIWSGVAAVWMLIFALDFAASDEHPPRMASHESTPSGAEVMTAFNERQRMVRELIGNGTGFDPEPAERPRYVPRPSSEMTTRIRLA